MESLVQYVLEMCDNDFKEVQKFIDTLYNTMYDMELIGDDDLDHIGDCYGN